MDSYWGFLVGRTAAKGRQDLRGVGNGPGASRFVAKWTVQIDRQRERTARDMVNNIRIKPTIATLIQHYNTVIKSS